MRLTSKQNERIQNKIKKIRKALYEEKKLFGGYHDGRGLRYIPPELYIKIQDYKGGLTYLRWFNKNFPDDIGMPIFLFEWTIILYKTGRIKEAEHKIIQTYIANSYLLDKFFNRPIIPIDKYEGSDWGSPELIEYFNYSKEQDELKDFIDWLAEFEKSEKFESVKSEY